VIDAAARLSHGWPSRESRALRLVRSAVVNLNGKDERFVTLSFYCVASLHLCTMFYLYVSTVLHLSSVVFF